MAGARSARAVVNSSIPRIWACIDVGDSDSSQPASAIRRVSGRRTRRWYQTYRRHASMPSAEATGRLLPRSVPDLSRRPRRAHRQICAGASAKTALRRPHYCRPRQNRVHPHESARNAVVPAASAPSLTSAARCERRAEELSQLAQLDRPELRVGPRLADGLGERMPERQHQPDATWPVSR